LTGEAQRGLFRQELGDESRTLASVFRRVTEGLTGRDRLTDARQKIFHACVDLQGPDDKGYWRFITVRDEIFAIITECEFAEARVERVVDEGFVEFHIVMSSPVELSLSKPDRDERKFDEATLIACRNAVDVGYSVHLSPGQTSMIGIYVDPDLLRESFGLDGGEIADIQKLLNPQPGTITVLEQRLTTEIIGCLREIRAIAFTEQRDLVLAAAKLHELLYFIVSALRSRENVDDPSVVFTQRDLLMFERARELLSMQLDRALTLPELAKELGTNATKLKSGFKLLYGTTIFSYRLRFRMDHAMKLLAEESMPISHVARAVGYERQASFTSAFKGHFGFLPKSVRRLQVTGKRSAK